MDPIYEYENTYAQPGFVKTFTIEPYDGINALEGELLLTIRMHGAGPAVSAALVLPGSELPALIDALVWREVGD